MTSNRHPFLFGFLPMPNTAPEENADQAKNHSHEGGNPETSPPAQRTAIP
jgi:hypothetical protein